MIDGGIARQITQSIHSTCMQEHAFIHALGFMPDHVHMAVSIPPTIAVAEFIRLVKGRSSHALNLNGVGRPGHQSKWQSDYSANSFLQRSLERVVAYVNNQDERHQGNTLWSEWERSDLMPKTR